MTQLKPIQKKSFKKSNNNCFWLHALLFCRRDTGKVHLNSPSSNDNANVNKFGFNQIELQIGSIRDLDFDCRAFDFTLFFGVAKSNLGAGFSWANSKRSQTKLYFGQILFFLLYFFAQFFQWFFFPKRNKTLFLLLNSAQKKFETKLNFLPQYNKTRLSVVLETNNFLRSELSVMWLAQRLTVWHRVRCYCNKRIHSPYKWFSFTQTADTTITTQTRCRIHRLYGRLVCACVGNLCSLFVWCVFFLLLISFYFIGVRNEQIVVVLLVAGVCHVDACLNQRSQYTQRTYVHSVHCQ